MPLTESGRKVLASMIKKHGDKKGTRVFYSSINKGVPGSDKWHMMEKEHKKISKYSKGLME